MVSRTRETSFPLLDPEIRPTVPIGDQHRLVGGNSQDLYHRTKQLGLVRQAKGVGTHALVRQVLWWRKSGSGKPDLLITSFHSALEESREGAPENRFERGIDSLEFAAR